MLAMIKVDRDYYIKGIKDILDRFEWESKDMLLCHAEYAANMLWWYSKCLRERIDDYKHKCTVEYYKRMEAAGQCAVCPNICYARKGEICPPYCALEEIELVRSNIHEKPEWCPKNEGETNE